MIESVASSPRTDYAVRSIFFPFIVAIASGIASWHYCFPRPLTDPGAIGALGGAITCVGATMLGFMLAALAIVASINNTHLVSMMKRYGHYDDLLLTLLMGCVWMLLCLICGFVVLFGAPVNFALTAICIALHGGGLIAILDVGRKLYLTLSHLREEQPIRDPQQHTPGIDGNR